jgi:3-oxoacyl-[acyl-carrier protein] reductase
VLNYVSDNIADHAKESAVALESKYGIKTHLVQADVGTEVGAAELITSAKGAFTDAAGKFQIDILINNAGIARNALLPDVKVVDFTETYRVNVLGPLLVTQATQPYLPTDRSGRIVNISSVSSTTGFVTQSVYGGSKAAIEAMTRTWSRELSARATVNAINPGPVEGPMYRTNAPEFMVDIQGWIAHTPLMVARPGQDSDELVKEAEEFGGRLARTTEVAGVVAMLCGPEAGWCTGQVVCANGGMLMLH